jgi:hypothetical protein
MATIGTRNLTLADLSKRFDGDGKIPKIIEILNQSHEILDDAVFMECNDGTTHKTTIRTGLPAPTWRKLYGGVLSTKSSTAQVIDSCGMLEALPSIDVDIVDKSPDPAATLLSEQAPHLEGIRQEVERALWYGDTTLQPEQFHGLNVRYNVKNTVNDETLSSFNVLSAGGVGADNTSMYLIGWGDATCHMLYPKGSKAGITQGATTKLFVAQDNDHTQGEFEAYRTKYKWDIGLSVRDWRSVGRICNIDVSDLEGASGTQNAGQLITSMIQLEERVMHYGGLGAARFSWVCHPRVRAALRSQYLGKLTSNFTWDTVNGKRVLAFGETPLRVSRQLSLAEAAL